MYTQNPNFAGSFTSDGTAKVLRFPSGIDWMEVRNYTTTAAGGAGTGVYYYWQKAPSILPDGYGFEHQKLAADESGSPVIITSGGFTYIETSTDSMYGALNSTITAISAATPPVVSLTSTAGLSTGDIVEFINVTGAQQFGGVHFEIGTVVANTSFPLTYAPTIVAGTSGSLRRVNVPMQFYPRKRFMKSITQANPAVITTTVSHGYSAGQKFRVKVPSSFGMVEMNNLIVTATAVTATTITTDVDASGFTAYAWPLTAAGPFRYAEIVPIGEASSSTYSNLLDDSVTNDAYIGISLAAGVDSPGGSSGDVILWRAGAVYSLNNE
jgi:hypothetical protein